MADGLDLGTLNIKIKAEGAKQTQKELDDVAKASENTDQKTQGTQNTMKSLGSAFMDAVKNTKVFGVSLGDLAGGLGDSAVQSAMLGGAMAALVSSGIDLAIQAITKLIGVMKELVVQTFEVGVEFQAQMSKVSALSGATNREFEQLVKGARKFGAETVFSATEAAQALEYTSLAGWDVQESMDGLPGILNLAAASSMELGKSSDIVTDYLTAFGMQAKESINLVDIMAYAMSNTNTNTEQLGEAYKNSASTAHAFGLSVEETTAWLGKMADAGKKGGEAGTALNSVLARLYGQNKQATDALSTYGLTMYEVNGDAKSFTQTMGEMQKAMKGMTDAEKNSFLRDVAGTNQLAAFNTMMAASADEVRGFTNEIENAGGTSDRMAKTMTDNIWGLQKSIESKFESIKLSIFSVFEPLISGVMKIYDSFLNVTDKLWQSMGGVLSKITGMITPFVDVIVATFNTIVDLAWPIIEPFFVLIETGVSKNLTHIKTFGDAFINVLDQIKNALMPFVEAVNNVLMSVVDVINGDWQSAMGRLEDAGVLAAQGVVNAFLLIPNTIIAVINAAIGGINEMMNISIEKMDYITADISGFFGKAKDNLGNLATGTKTAFENVGSTIKDACEEGEKAIQGLGKVYEDYLQKNMSEYEKQLREQYDGGTLREEKKIQEKLALHERMLKKQLEEDEKYEKRKLEMQEKYYTKTVTENGRTSISYVPRNANGTSNFSGGLTRMNEVGPELTFVQKGAQIVNNHETKEMFNNIADNSGVESRLDGLRTDIQELKRVLKMLPSEQQMLDRGGMV